MVILKSVAEKQTNKKKPPFTSSVFQTDAIRSYKTKLKNDAKPALTLFFAVFVIKSSVAVALIKPSIKIPIFFHLEHLQRTN